MAQRTQQSDYRKRDTQIHGTTVLCVRRDGKVVMAGDGQVTLGDTMIKQTAKKIRWLSNEKVLAGFAGSTADSLSLFERFDSKLQEHHGNLQRAARVLDVTDRMLQKHRADQLKDLEAMVNG